MAISKVDFSFENLHFSCKGDNAWVERQLNNVLSRIPSLLAVHNKSENIVEEVYEVSEEDLKEEEAVKEEPNMSEDASSPAKGARIPKVKKAKAAKIPKVKVLKEKKIKAPKAAKIPKVKVAKEPISTLESEPAKRGRKPKTADKPAAKVKVAKKKVTSSNKPVEQIDSPLFQFVSEKKAASNQVRKFLATAVFLSRSNNVSKLSTSMISRALKSYGIEKLQNASDCLNKNEKKGYCIKDGKEFIITENGYLSIE